MKKLGDSRTRPNASSAFTVVGFFIRAPRDRYAIECKRIRFPPTLGAYLAETGIEGVR